MNEYRYVGKSVPREREGEKLTGRAVFAGDLRLPGMLWGKILHSPHAHARILGIEIGEALKVPGVRAVVTEGDTPGVRIGRWLQDRSVLARGEVRYIGEPVAAVAAVDPEAAEEALERIVVTYEELPAVFDPLEAMRPDSPLVHGDRGEIEPLKYRGRGEGNVFLEGVLRQGDVEQGLAMSEVVHEGRYSTQAVHPGFIEPHAVVAAVDAQGKVTAWSSTKAPFNIRHMTAKALGIPLSRIRVISPLVGGDFGGKGTAYIEPIAVLLSLKSGLPVKLVLSRQEELTSTFVRESAVIDLTMGAKRDGRFCALKGRIVFNSGAYYDLGGALDLHLLQLAGPYRIPHIELTAYRVYTNTIPRGHVRAPSAPHPTFARESHIDGLAAKLRCDPLAMRMQNGVQDGDIVPGEGAVLKSMALKSTQAVIATQMNKKRGPREQNRGWGVACGQWGVHPLEAGTGPTSSAWVKINEDGTVVLSTGSVDSGGGQHTIYGQIVAEILGISPDAVVVSAADTDATPFELGTGGSRTTYRVGTSARLAAQDARDRILHLAAEQMECLPGDLVLRDGSVCVKGSPDKNLSLAALASASLTSRKGPLIGIGEAHREQMLDRQREAEHEVDEATCFTHAAQVEVDPSTGMVRVLNYLAAHDVGYAINPANVRGQIEGGVVFGLGYAVSEELVIDEGRVQNPDLTDYRLPNLPNVPPVEAAIIEERSRFGPFGAKGVGEPPSIPVAPAIANAVYDAIGVRIHDLPVTPEKILRATGQLKIEEKQER